MSLHRLPYCRDCLRKQQEIDRLKEENARLKDRLRSQERNAKEAPFGSSTPSAKQLVKPNSLEDNQKKKGGARPGHAGRGRRPPQPEEVTRTQRVLGPEACPDCGARLSAKGFKRRTVMEVVPVQKEVIVYELEQGDCPRCHRVFTARAPGVFAKGLFGNRLLAYVAQEHYVHGTTMGRLARQLAAACWGPCMTWPPGWNRSRTGWLRSTVGRRSSTPMRRVGATTAGMGMRGFFAPCA